MLEIFRHIALGLIYKNLEKDSRAAFACLLSQVAKT